MYLRSSNDSNEHNKISKELYFVVLATGSVENNNNDCILVKLLSTIELAIKKVQSDRLFGVNIDVTIISRDTFCSSTYGSIGFFEIYSNFKEKINAILGLPCDYVLAPISRHASVWEIPVLSTSGRSRAFDDKSFTYSTLTRLMGGVGAMGESMKGLINSFNWTKSAFIVQNSDEDVGNSVCFLCIISIDEKIGNKGLKSYKFSKELSEKNAIEALTKISESARIVIMCADKKSIRRIMLSAQDMNMIDSGEYVFINIELFSNKYQLKSMLLNSKTILVLI
uniref:Receptor ligand binding region domain-containing protein n=1 Tax=Megaselia scalaris TaxID=36166 RepID=T1GB07_MEGSC